MTALVLISGWFLLSVVAGLLIGRGISVLYNAEEHGLQLIWED